MSESTLSLGAILYPGFEMLDMFGPLEMFSLVPDQKIEIRMIGQNKGPVVAALGSNIHGGPKVIAEYDFEDAPALDIILVPGGYGTIPELDNLALLKFLKVRSEQAQITASVCTGSALLAKAGVLDGHKATSNKQIFALSVMQSDKVEWIEEARWVDDGPVVTSSGVSAGMDMSIAIIERLFGSDTAQAVASDAEYTRHRDASNDPFISELNDLSKKMGLI
jgi:transcriptional regulator GlxA family with amidase domain